MLPLYWNGTLSLRLMWWPSLYKALITHRFHGHQDLLTFVWTRGCMSSVNLFHVGFARLTGAKDRPKWLELHSYGTKPVGVQSSPFSTCRTSALSLYKCVIRRDPNVLGPSWSRSLEVVHPSILCCGENWRKMKITLDQEGSLLCSPTRCHSTSTHSMWGLKVSASD